MRFLSLLCVFLLHRNQMEEPVLHPERCNNQFVPAIRLRIARKHVKYCCCVLTDLCIACQQATVRIQLCRRIVIVSRAKMYISANACLLAPNHQCDLTVCFQSQKTINYMASRLFQHLRPDNIVFFVKPCL